MPLTGADSEGTKDHHGYWGVYPSGEKFTAGLRVDGVLENVGSHATADAAAKALDRCLRSLLHHCILWFTC